jgi:hypothetical protein
MAFISMHHSRGLLYTGLRGIIQTPNGAEIEIGQDSSWQRPIWLPYRTSCDGTKADNLNVTGPGSGRGIRNAAGRLIVELIMPTNSAPAIVGLHASMQ